jgi:beta-lactamase class A
MTAASVGLCVALTLAMNPGRVRADAADSAGVAVARVPSPAALWLQTLEPDTELQKVLDERVEKARRADPSLKRQTIRVSLIDVPVDGPPTLAHWKGDSPVYPASVPKFAYLMATYKWREQGKLEIDSTLDRNLRAMVYASSNRATQKVVSRLTETEPGPRLEPAEYAEFVEKRHAVKRWLQELGITDLHLVHPTYDGGGDLYGRDEQFLHDTEIPGCLPDQTGEYRNRAAMTSNDTAELLALLATDRALSPESSEEVRERMRRSTRKQAYLAMRITGGAEKCGVKGVEVFAKTGTWGPIHADSGIVRAPSGRQLVVSAFIEGAPRYRGRFIAQITEAACRLVFARESEKASPVGPDIH